LKLNKEFARCIETVSAHEECKVVVTKQRLLPKIIINLPSGAMLNNTTKQNRVCKHKPHGFEYKAKKSSQHVGSRGPGSKRMLSLKPLQLNNGVIDLLCWPLQRRLHPRIPATAFVLYVTQVYMAKLAEQAERYDEMVNLPTDVLRLQLYAACRSLRISSRSLTFISRTCERLTAATMTNCRRGDTVLLGKRLRRSLFRSTIQAAN
jgi:hypothetical protein